MKGRGRPHQPNSSCSVNLPTRPFPCTADCQPTLRPPMACLWLTERITTPWWWLNTPTVAGGRSQRRLDPYHPATRSPVHPFGPRPAPWAATETMETLNSNGLDALPWTSQRPTYMFRPRRCSTPSDEHRSLPMLQTKATSPSSNKPRAFRFGLDSPVWTKPVRKTCPMSPWSARSCPRVNSTTTMLPNPLLEHKSTTFPMMREGV